MTTKKELEATNLLLAQALKVAHDNITRSGNAREQGFAEGLETAAKVARDCGGGTEYEILAERLDALAERSRAVLG